MGFDGIKGILRDVIVTLGSEVIEDFAHQHINAHPTLLGQAFQFVELCVGKFDNECAHGLLPLLSFSFPLMRSIPHAGILCDGITLRGAFLRLTATSALHRNNASAKIALS